MQLIRTRILSSSHMFTVYILQLSTFWEIVISEMIQFPKKSFKIGICRA
jgi:hypothetical protein